MSGCGGREDAGGDCVTGIVGKRDLPVETKGQHRSVRALKGHAMNVEIYFAALAFPLHL